MKIHHSKGRTLRIKLFAGSLLSATLVITTLGLNGTPDFALGSTSQDPSVPIVEEAVPREVPLEDRADILGSDWAASDDLLWNVIGDGSALNLLVARESEGYGWRNLAALSLPGIETDRWIGNACLTSDGSAFAVVYAPRTFTNDPVLATHGAFASLVDAATGEQTYIGQGYSLAYFNPGCGTADQIVLSQFDEELVETRLTLLEASDPASSQSVITKSQVTSATADDMGIIAASGGAIVRVDAAGTLEEIVETAGSAYDLRLDASSGLGYVEHDGETATAKRVDLTNDDPPLEVVEGPITEVGLKRDLAGGVYVVGTTPTEPLPANWVSLDAPVNVDVSTEGQAFVVEASNIELSDGITDPMAPGVQVDFKVETVETGETFTVAADSSAPISVSDAVTTSSFVATYGSGSATNPVEAERACSVPRNDPANQAMQPTPEQAMWAVERGVKGNLTLTRPANWKNLGMPSYSPQDLFPLSNLSGGGRVPAQVMLGILAQESNLWQASKYTLPGVTGNPLIGNYYGTSGANWWEVHFDRADCGYGIAQITDGMRLAGRERAGETALPYNQQRAIALDYTANIAKGVDMLADKWNQTRNGGLTINNGDPKYIENWFFAVWAYNSGYYPEGAAGQPWGVGWFNNPINPNYTPSRLSFLDGSPSDASHPQEWPYPEKVMGFAANSLELPISDIAVGVAFTPAWWNANDNAGGAANRTQIKPPLTTFCVASINQCQPGTLQQPNDALEKPGPCFHQNALGQYDLKCWYHGNATWKPDCLSHCGREYIVFNDTYLEPEDATSLLPNCTKSGLPSNAMVIDNVPNGTSPVRGNCSSPVATVGSFGFNFQGGAVGEYPSKVDLHQLGGGFNGQFYFSHSRNTADTMGKLKITGTWNLGQSLNSWARVLVHTPNQGAWTQQAAYTVNTGANGSQTRTIAQRNYANEWVSLGVFEFNGVPTVSLSNTTKSGEVPSLDDENKVPLSGIDDIAWDSIAIVPLTQKPTDFVVALGDSFSSGEGASAPGGVDYYRSSDNHGMNAVGNQSAFQNACHRSKDAWSRKGATASFPLSTIGERADAGAQTLDYHLLACSGAIVNNVLPYYSAAPGSQPEDNNGLAGRGQFDEVSQLDRGFLDKNTTLVTISIGGNDMMFSHILEKCLTNTFNVPCSSLRLDGDTENLDVVTPERIETDVYFGVITTLEEIHLKAPNAEILLMGYPKLFADGSECVGIGSINQPWINEMSELLNEKLGEAAIAAGPHVRFADPTTAFAGKNLCTPGSGINGLIFDLTPGEYPMLNLPVPGQNIQAGVSAQSIHPNKIGTSLYAQAMNAALSDTPAIAVGSSMVPGQPTTYFATFRPHLSGPAAIQMNTVPGCGGATRLGLRMWDGTQAVGTQSTDTLQWPAAGATQYFSWIMPNNGGTTHILPTGSYAFNGRQVGGCGGATQAWSGLLKW